MASSDDALETYTHIPVEITGTDANASIVSASTDPSIQKEVEAVNALLTLFRRSKIDGRPPPPIPVVSIFTNTMNQSRTKAVAELKKNKPLDALGYQDQAIKMATNRYPWEPVGLVREELATCYMERSGIYSVLQKWPEAFKDAECSIECKKGPQQLPNGQKTPGNPGAWLSGGKALMAMGRWSEAVAWLQQGFEVEDENSKTTLEIKALLQEAKTEAGRRSESSQNA